MSKTLKLLGRGVAWTAIVIAGLAVTGLSYRAGVQHGNEKALAIRSPEGIDQSMFVPIGGIDQWVTIRGEDRANPVLVFLHGGPGAPLGALAYEALRPLEKSFTIVHWDQRGAGRTYGQNPDMPASSLSLRQLEADTGELIEFVRKRLGKDRVGLVGTSAGSAFGLSLAQHRPDLLYAYVGVGQIVSPRLSDEHLYAHLMKRAQETKNEEALRELRAIGKPPFQTMDESQVARKWDAEFAPPSEKAFNNQLRLLKTMATAPGSSPGDVLDIISGVEFSAKQLIPQYDQTEARDLGRTFEVPLIFIQGDQDYLTSTALVKDYAAWVQAPRKDVIILPGAGHSVALAMPGRFIDILVGRVRPLAADGRKTAMIQATGKPKAP